MKVQDFVDTLDSSFFTGVPDSLLRPLCDYLIDTYKDDTSHHIIAANEGNCTAIAAGYHLATGKTAVVYMQNSGEGNIVNPVCSLLHKKVYAIPCIFVVGWRGEPGVHDEPQHIYQGEVTLKLLEDLEIPSFVISCDTTKAQIEEKMAEYKQIIKNGNSVAFVVRKNALSYDNKVNYKNDNILKREDIIRTITKYTKDDPIVSTTGKASRELFEIREENENKDHKKDFLTVGSMGHTSSIALGIALQKKNQKVWCIDGDGSVLMHMGSMAVNATSGVKNMVHIVINNGAHETVGGMNTAAKNIRLCDVAKDCGYKLNLRATNMEELKKALEEARKSTELTFIEVLCAIGARSDLGRPTTTAKENKEHFMTHLASL